MTLYDCQKNHQYRILAIHTQDTFLKERLISMGIYTNTLVSLQYTTLAKSTLCITANGVQIALRAEEAKEIEVEAIN